MDVGDKRMSRTYAGVLFFELVVLLALWAAERYFTAP